MSLLVAAFAHGCRCIDCDAPILNGEPYVRRLSAFVGELPMSEVVCWTCGRLAEQALDVTEDAEAHVGLGGDHMDYGPQSVTEDE